MSNHDGSGKENRPRPVPAIGANPQRLSKDASTADLSIAWVHRAVNNNSQSAWTFLDVRYRKMLLAFARLEMGPSLDGVVDPEDIVQTAWCRAAIALRQSDFKFEYGGPGSLRKWLCQLIRWTVIDQVRQRKLDRIERHSDPGEVLSRIADDSSDAVDFESIDLIVATLRKVPETHRGVIVARVIEGLSYAEIGERDGIPEQTARKQYQRGLDAWKAALGQRDFMTLLD